MLFFVTMFKSQKEKFVRIYLDQRCHCHFVFWPKSNLPSLVTTGDADDFGN